MFHTIRVSGPPEDRRAAAWMTTNSPGIRLAGLLCLATMVFSPMPFGVAVAAPEAVGEGKEFSVCLDELDELRTSRDTCRDENDRQTRSISELTSRLNACRTARLDDQATTKLAQPRRLIGWFRNALGRIAEQALGFGGADCRTVAVDYDPESGQAAVRLHMGAAADPDTRSEQALERTLTDLFPKLKLRIERAPLPEDCVPSTLHRESRPTIPKPAILEPTTSRMWEPEPDIPPPTSRDPKPASPSYRIRYDRYGEAALVLAQRLGPNERSRLPDASECPTLGPWFERTVPIDKRSVPAFLVIDGNRTVPCTKSDGDWYVRRNTFSPIEAHLLLRE